MKLRYMIDMILREDKNGQPVYEPVGVWVQGRGPGLDIEMFYIDSRDPLVLARKEEADWVINRLVENDVTTLPDDFLEYHRDSQSPYWGRCAPIVATQEFADAHELGKTILSEVLSRRSR